MTWEPKIMPDDAPELAGSLVGSILGVEPVNPQPTSNDLPARSSKRSDLCNAMVDVCLDTTHVYTEKLMADVLDVVRDWLTPEEHDPFVQVPPQDKIQRFRLGYWQARQDIRALLTEQARIAREES